MSARSPIWGPIEIFAMLSYLQKISLGLDEGDWHLSLTVGVLHHLRLFVPLT